MTTQNYTEQDVREAVLAYAAHHEVEPEAVDVSRRHDAGGRVVGFRLSLDAGGRSRGCDETVGEWR